MMSDGGGIIGNMMSYGGGIIGNMMSDGGGIIGEHNTSDPLMLTDCTRTDIKCTC